MGKKDEKLISIGELDAKYGLPLYDVGDEEPEKGIYRNINPDELGFKTTAEIETPKGLERLVGQEKPVREILEGLAIDDTAYNIIICGNSEQQMPLIIQSVIEEHARRTGAVKNTDQVAYPNFKNPLQPYIVSIPAGEGAKLVQIMGAALSEVAKYAPTGTNAAGFLQKLYELEKIKENAEQNILKSGIDFLKQQEVNAEISGKKLKLVSGKKGELKKPSAPESFDSILAPTLQPTDNAEGTEEEKMMNVECYLRGVEEYMKEVKHSFDQQKQKLSKHFAALDMIDTIGGAHKRVLEMYKDMPAEDFAPMKQVIDYIFGHLEQNPSNITPKKSLFNLDGEAETNELIPSLLVDNSSKEGLISLVATYPDSTLLGSVESNTTRKPYHARLVAGEFAKANNGILAINHADLLFMPYGLAKFELLKVLETGKASLSATSIWDKGLVANCDARFKLVAGVSGDGNYLAKVQSNDRLKAFFKKRIMLERKMKFSIENAAKIGKAIKAELSDYKEASGMEFSNSGVARTVEHLLAIFGKDKIALNADFLKDMVVRACTAAKGAGKTIVDNEDIDIAYSQYKGEKNNYERAFRENIKKGFFIINDKPEIGVVNGLSYLGTEIPFGRSLRIGVTVRPTPSGSGRFVNIDEKADLSGEMFTKSFLQVASMIRELYQEKDVQMHFDLETSVSQSDHGINGPSAGAAMSLACISALAEVPVEPHVFYTGGIDPKSGKVTIIGGVNEKVMGVYYTCRDLGIKDGIAVIPKTNVGDLQLLEPEVHEAIRKGEFRVYAHGHINETIEIGTRMKAEEVHEKVKERLRDLNKHYDEKDKKEECEK